MKLESLTHGTFWTSPSIRSLNKLIAGDPGSWESVKNAASPASDDNAGLYSETSKRPFSATLRLSNSKVLLSGSKPVILAWGYIRLKNRIDKSNVTAAVEDEWLVGAKRESVLSFEEYLVNQQEESLRRERVHLHSEDVKWSVRIMGVAEDPGELSAHGKHPVFEAGTDDLGPLQPVESGKSEAIIKDPQKSDNVPDRRGQSNASAIFDSNACVHFYHPLATSICAKLIERLPNTALRRIHAQSK